MSKIQHVRSPKDVLTGSVRDLGIAPQAKMTFERFPDLEGASEGLAWLLTDRLMYPAPTLTARPVPLLHLCLKHAFEWMNYELSREGPTFRTAQTAYMAGLLFTVPELLLLQVEGDDETWTIANAAPLGEWLPRHPGARMVTLPDIPDDALDDRQVRLQVLMRILPIPVPRLEVNLASVLLPPDLLQPPRGFYGR